MSDNQSGTYREALRAPWWLWLVVTFMSASLGLAYDYALGLTFGMLSGLLAWGLCAWGLIRWTLLIEVDQRGVRVGRARLPLRYAGRSVALDAEASRRMRTVDADARAFLALRTTVTAESVLLEVTDPADPHPYWLISTRRPQDLAAAIDSARRTWTASEPVAG